MQNNTSRIIHGKLRLFLLSFLAIGIFLAVLFVRDIPTRMTNGDYGRVAIATLDEVRRPFLEIHAAESLLMNDGYSESVQRSLDKGIKRGRGLIGEFKKVTQYNPMVQQQAERLGKSFESWVEDERAAFAHKAKTRTDPQSDADKNAGHHLFAATSAGFSRTMEYLGNVEGPIHDDIHYGSQAVTELTVLSGVLMVLLLGLVVNRGHAARCRADTLATLNRELAAKNKERRRIERSLEESELWQRGIFDSLEEGVLVATPDRLMVNMNPASQTMLGYSQEEIAGQPTAMVHVDHDHVVEFGRRIKEAFEKGEAARFEFELKRKNGEVFPTEHTVSLIRNEQGGAIGIVSILRDITARKHTEVELRRHREHLEEQIRERTSDLQVRNEQLQNEIVVRKQSEEKLKAQTLRNEIILATMQDGFWVIDLEGNIRDVNEAYCRMMGYTREQLQTMTVADIEASESPEEVQLHIQKILSQGHDHFETRHRRKDGTLIDLDISVTRANWGGTQVLFTFFRDIRERIQAQRELEHSRQQLRDLAVHLQTVREEDRALIARDVHDELGQVLTALNMDVYWLQEHITDDQSEIKRKAMSMAPLIASAIKSVQRITSELRPAMLDDLGLGPVIQWYLDEFQERTGIECEFTMVSDEMQIDSDHAIAVFRIVQEALTNVARHAVGASRVSVDIRGGDDHLDVQITDNGRGISPSATSADNAFGLLGMKERALAFGGSADIEGCSGGGTVVSLHMPLDTSTSSILT